MSVIIGGVIFVASVSLMVPLKKGVQPEGNPNYYYINIQGPPGATLADMRVVVAKLDDLLARQPETQDVFAQVGGQNVSDGPGGGFTRAAGTNPDAAVAVL